jgi:DNA-directed RNA polymerase subunit RPC12/RpoP
MADRFEGQVSRTDTEGAIIGWWSTGILVCPNCWEHLGSYTRFEEGKARCSGCGQRFFYRKLPEDGGFIFETWYREHTHTADTEDAG